MISTNLMTWTAPKELVVFPLREITESKEFQTGFFFKAEARSSSLVSQKVIRKWRKIKEHLMKDDLEHHFGRENLKIF